MLAEVAAGLAAPQKELPPKYFYDRRGSELFEEITRLPEYYLTRAERSILEAWMPSLLPELGVHSLVELGAGSAAKTRVILEALRAAGGPGTYVPIDVSADFLDDTAQTLRHEFPGLAVQPVIGDIDRELVLPDRLPRPMLVAFLGSTIGNFDPAAALGLLLRVRHVMRPDDRFLLGVDLRKDVAVLEAAYNDGAGVTAAFNRNVLHVLNRELGADFDVAAFEHRAVYDRELHRIEMYLVSTREQEVHLPGAGRFRLARGETIRTEISCKYDRASVAALFRAARFRIGAWRTDPEGRFALVLGVPE